MYEFSQTQHLLDRALAEAESKRIVRIHLLIGPFSEEREESIRFYWRDLARGSRGEGAELRFEHLPLAVRCLNCTGSVYLDEKTSMCEFCSGKRSRLFSGDDVWLERLELE
jgi:hydrogenase nickel incorporation protein HypA/HybF